MIDPARERLEWAMAQLADCRLCPRQCRVNRLAGDVGWCGAAAEPRFYAEFVHYGEEAELVPSHAVFLTGCNMRCAFCHTADERRTRPSEVLTPERLEAIVRHARANGARNLNILGGEPMVNLPGLLALLAAAADLPPVVWNTNLYCTREALSMVDGVADVYLADLKFGNADCARATAMAEDYWDVVRARLVELYRRRPETILLRHLVLPGHVECCTRPALEWAAAALRGVRVSLRLDYLVMPAARSDPRLGRFLSAAECESAAEFARTLGLRLVPQAARIDPVVCRAAGGIDPAIAAAPTMDVEFVISPEGKLFVRHPTREAVALARRVSGAHEPLEAQ